MSIRVSTPMTALLRAPFAIVNGTGGASFQPARRRMNKVSARAFTLRRQARAAGAGRIKREDQIMTWTTPTLVEICVGLEINGYLAATL
jgi:coenzyme PQQ precursor peptide PqqA